MASILDDLLTFGGELRAEILEWVKRLEVVPPQDDARSESIIIWIRTLAVAVWDMSESVFALLTADRNHLRAVKVLNRSLFEYSMKMKYFGYRPDDAQLGISNVRVHLGKLTKANKTFSPDTMAPEERKVYEALLAASDDKLKREHITSSIRMVLEKDGRSDEVPAVLDNYYPVASGYAHGSETLILDMWRQHGSGYADTIELKSQRLYTIAGFDEAIRSLLGTLEALSMHLQQDLCSARITAYRDHLHPRVIEELKLQDERARKAVIDRGPIQTYD